MRVTHDALLPSDAGLDRTLWHDAHDYPVLMVRVGLMYTEGL